VLASERAEERPRDRLLATFYPSHPRHPDGPQAGALARSHAREHRRRGGASGPAQGACATISETVTGGLARRPYRVAAAAIPLPVAGAAAARGRARLE